jgi:hypothetical protein
VNVGLGQPEKLSVAQHKFGIGHNTEFGSTSILDITLGYMDCLLQEATEIWVHHINFNRGRGCNLSQSWYPVKRSSGTATNQSEDRTKTNSAH